MLSFAFGIGTQNTQGDWLEIYYPVPLLHPDAGLVEAVSKALDAPTGNSAVSFLPEHCAALATALRAAGHDAQLQRTRLWQAQGCGKRGAVFRQEADGTVASGSIERLATA